MTDIFVSYSRKDKEVVKKLVDVMTAQGWSVWWDPTIRAGEYFEDVIEQALYDCKCVIVVWSHNSVKSKWVRAEAAEAANRDVLVPVVIDNAKIPFRFKQIQEARLLDWQTTPDHPELTKLLESIAQKLIQSQPTQPKSLGSEARPKMATRPFHSEKLSAGRIDELTTGNSPTEDDETSITDRHPIPHPPYRMEAAATGSSSRFITRRVLLATILIIIGIGGGLIYLFATRENPTDTKIDNRQASAGNATLPSPSTTSTDSPSPEVSPTASPAGLPVNARRLSALLKGQWQSQTSTTRECECASSACLNIEFNKTITDFCVESNQVYVSAFYKLDSANKKAYLFFENHGELGAGASRMPWDRFDREKPLATIDLTDIETQKVIYVKWHGFTETGAVRQTWRQIGSGFQGTYLKR